MINDETLVALTEEREELIARSETLYDALTDCYAIAKKGLLPREDQADALTRIVYLVRRIKGELDAMLNAAQFSGFQYDLLDDEAMDWYDAVDRQFHLLNPEGKRRFVAARKRAEVARQKGRPPTEWKGDERKLTLHTSDPKTGT